MTELAEIAGSKRVWLEFIRHGGEHDIYRIGVTKMSIPRHRDSNELTACRLIETATTAS